MTKKEIAWAKANITSGVEEIDPTTALIMLQKNKKNRAQNKNNIQFYTQEMNANNWQCNGEGVIIDQNGNIMDGQHRLEAIVLSGKSQAFVVTRGVQRKAYTTMNQGSKRTTGQILNQAGNTYGNDLSAIVRIVHHYNTQNFTRLGKTGRISPTTTQTLLANYRKSHNTIDDSLLFAKATCKKKFACPFRPNYIASLHYILSQIDQADADFFIEYLTTGVINENYVYAINPKKSLNVVCGELNTIRNHFITLKSANSALIKSRHYTIGTLINCWNRFQKGTKVSASGFKYDSPTHGNFPVAT
jgi:hypothetical protein